MEPAPEQQRLDAARERLDSALLDVLRTTATGYRPKVEPFTDAVEELIRAVIAAYDKGY